LLSYWLRPHSRKAISPLTCNASAASQPLIRAEGVAELVGDFLLTCTGGIIGNGGSATFTLYFNSTVTSHIVAPESGGSEAMLLIDDLSTSPTLGVNVIQSVVNGGTVTFYNVPIQAPGNGTRTFRMTNLRVNADGITGWRQRRGRTGNGCPSRL
jgi:hypothetical protein